MQLIAVAKGLVQYPPGIMLTFLSISNASPTVGFTSRIVSKTFLFEMTLLLAGSAHCRIMATHTAIFYIQNVCFIVYFA